MLGFETVDLLCGMLALDEYERILIEEINERPVFTKCSLGAFQIEYYARRRG